MKTLFHPLSALAALVLLATPALADAPPVVNPLLPSGADPWAIHHDGWYYYMHSTQHNLTLRKTRHIGELSKAEPKVIWTPEPGTAWCKDIWAPEIHHFGGKWYIYFSGHEGDQSNHRVWALENASPDPMLGTWTMKGKLATKSDKWAIDGSAFEFNGRLYFIWSGWEGDVNGVQNIYIAAMKNPWSLEGERVLVSTPTYPWEKVGDRPFEPAMPHIDVNEGPQALVHNDRVFIIFSASGCWTDHYSLALVSAKPGGDLLDSATWTKAPKPVFVSAPDASAFATGHNSFFKSPDGSEDWLLFHANSKPGQGCGTFRSPRAQPIEWRGDGTPDLGQALPPGTPIQAPSGE